MAPKSKKNDVKNGAVATTATVTAAPSHPIDPEDETSTQSAMPKSAEDRKAAAALSNIDDTSRDELGGNNVSRHDIDHEAVRKAMERLSASSNVKAATTSPKYPSLPPRKIDGAHSGNNANSTGVQNANKSVKVDAADVAFIVEELELSKIKATDLLKSYGGDIQKCLRTYLQPDFSISQL